MKKIATAILLAAALGFTTSPANAETWSQFVIHLAKYSCQGQSAKFQNGCYAYIEPRVYKASSPADALAWCKGNKRCGKWYTDGTPAKQLCDDGCTYLYNMGN